jgi:hypothetical protein
MKTFKPYLIIAACLLAALSACKKDKVIPGLAGTWYRDSKSIVGLQHESYEFKIDSTMVFTRAYYDTTSKALIGYNYKMTGIYSFNGQALKIVPQHVYAFQTAPYYASLQNLLPITTPGSQNVTIQFAADNASFTLIYPPCGPNENCISYLVYKKQP